MTTVEYRSTGVETLLGGPPTRADETVAMGSLRVATCTSTVCWSDGAPWSDDDDVNLFLEVLTPGSAVCACVGNRKRDLLVDLFYVCN